MFEIMMLFKYNHPRIRVSLNFFTFVPKVDIRVSKIIYIYQPQKHNFE